MEVNPQNATQFVINKVMPPDESAGCVNNSVYTNMIVGNVLNFAYKIGQVRVLPAVP